jgi:hypothetical protein
LQSLSQKRGYLVQDDLLPLFAPPAPGPRKAAQPEGGGINYTLLKAYFDGDVASLREGPRPDAPAPDFKLPTPDGKQSITLSNHLGKRPIVLVFGSFT